MIKVRVERPVVVERHLRDAVGVRDRMINIIEELADMDPWLIVVSQHREGQWNSSYPYLQFGA